MTTIEDEFYITNTAFIFDYQLEFSSISYKVFYHSKNCSVCSRLISAAVERFKNAGPSVHPRDAQPTLKQGRTTRSVVNTPVLLGQAPILWFCKYRMLDEQYYQKMNGFAIR